MLLIKDINSVAVLLLNLIRQEFADCFGQVLSSFLRRFDIYPWPVAEKGLLVLGSLSLLWFEQHRKEVFLSIVTFQNIEPVLRVFWFDTIGFCEDNCSF